MSRRLAEELVVASDEEIDELVVVDAAEVVDVDVLHDEVDLAREWGVGAWASSGPPGG